MEASDERTNPYAVTSELVNSCIPSPKPSWELVGTTCKELPPEEIRLIERDLQKPTGSLWILPMILFLVFCFVAATIPMPFGMKFFLWGLVGAIPILSWIAIHSSIRTVSPGLQRLTGSGENRVRITCDDRGFRLRTEGVEQYGIWAMVHGHVPRADRWILLFASVMHRSGLIVQSTFTPEKLLELDRYVLACRRNPSNQKVSNRLIDSVEMESVQISNPILKVNTLVYSKDMIDETPEDWIWLRRYFIASVGLRINLVLLAGTTLSAVLDNQWMALFVVLPLAVATLFKLRRGFRVLFRKEAVISELELILSSDGYEKRSNAHHSRVHWSVHREPEVIDGRLFARYQGATKKQPIFAKRWFSTEADWDRACQIAKEKIPRD